MTAVVYRVFDVEGALLYIGSTSDFGARKAVHLATHATPIAFTIQTCVTRWETTDYPDMAAAKAAEIAAIRNEAPYLNRQHNPTRWAKRDGGWVPLLPEYVRPPRLVPSLDLMELLGLTPSAA